jgi:hypothetical protein
MAEALYRRFMEWLMNNELERIRKHKETKFTVLSVMKSKATVISQLSAETNRIGKRYLAHIGETL